MHNPRYALFYDFHTMPACPDAGKDFDAEAFTDRIRDCGVDYLTFHARCNMGMAYYDTRIGIKHPSLEYDLFGKLADACKQKSIALTAYFNGGISHAEGIQHRDWTRLHFDGTEYGTQHNRDWTNPFVRTMCFNTPYRKHLIAMILEVVEKYPVAGIFVDCLGPYACICPVCIEEMKAKSIDWRNRNEVDKFAAFSAARLAEDIAIAVKKVNAGLLMFFNGVAFEAQKDFCTYLECECLPTGESGYGKLPVFSRYMRTITDKPILNMTGRFHKDWGDFGGIRTKASLEFDLYYGLANGMRPNVGGHLHPRGDINHAVFDLIEKTYKEIQQYEPWFSNAESQTEIAVVANSNGQVFQMTPEIMGATNMLEELKYQFDVVTGAANWDKYKVIILPDNITLDEEYARRIKRHLDSGKVVISSAFSGLDPRREKFVLDDYWRVKYLGENTLNPAYFRVEPEYAQNIPSMPLNLYETGTEIEAHDPSSVKAEIIAPYYNLHWDGEYPFFYAPPEQCTGKPALVVDRQLAHFSHPVFRIYYNHAPVPLKTLFGNVLKKLFPEPLIASDNSPSYARLLVTTQPNRKIVHLLSFLPEARGRNTHMIEEPIELRDIRISLKLDGKEPENVYSAPFRKSLPFSVENGRINVTIPYSNGYSMTVFEQ